MTEWQEEVECLRNWTMKTVIGMQEEYDNLWEEINHKMKLFALLEEYEVKHLEYLLKALRLD